MSDKTTSQEVDASGPDYVGWRGELLAQLALSRLPSLTIFQAPADHGFDFLVSTEHGLCFFVDVKAYSSTRAKISNPSEIDDLIWHLDAELVEKATQCRSPVVLFLFDADTDHGRFLRLDTLAPSPAGNRRQTVKFPRTNVISRESLQRLVSELEARP